MPNTAPTAAARPTDPGLVAAWLATVPADSLLAEAQALATEVANLSGVGLRPQEGCAFHWSNLGDARVLIEYEVEPSEGDGRDSEHLPQRINLLGAFLNGEWVEPDDIELEGATARWISEIAAQLAKEAEADKADAAIARAEQREEALS